VPALETLPGLRVVATPDALDGARWSDGTIVLRFAPDDAFGLGAIEAAVTDEHLIVVPETGFVGAWLTGDQLRDLVLPHVEWPLPDERPALAQGLIAGVPAKLWLGDDRALLLCAEAYARELSDRLG
jgi:hypothetical protein